jgi:acyl-CoA thioesterase-1
MRRQVYRRPGASVLDLRGGSEQLTATIPGMRKALLLLLLLAACRPDVPNLDSPGRTIVCLGDSITAGVGSGPGESYPDLLAARLGTEVINAGVSGETAAGGLARVDQVLARDPWLVVVELGGNDLLRRIPPEETEQSLRRILDRLVTARVVPVLVEMDAPFGGRYLEIYERLGDEYHVPVVEDAVGEILRDRSLKSDTIHPNAAGQKVLAEAIAEEIEPLIEARRKAR